MTTAMPWRTATQRRADLAAATAGLDLSDDERRTLDWLAEWEPETVAAVVGMLGKARGGDPRTHESAPAARVSSGGVVSAGG